MSDSLSDEGPTKNIDDGFQNDEASPHPIRSEESEEGFEPPANVVQNPDNEEESDFDGVEEIDSPGHGQGTSTRKPAGAGRARASGYGSKAV